MNNYRKTPAEVSKAPPPPQNSGLTETYKEFVWHAQKNETTDAWRSYAEAWQACLNELPGACERQGFDAAYELALIKRQLRSRRPKVRREALESLDDIFYVLADEDMEFAFLHKRYENLEERIAFLDEQHAIERRNAGIKPSWAFTHRICSYLLRRL